MHWLIGLLCLVSLICQFPSIPLLLDAPAY